MANCLNPATSRVIQQFNPRQRRSRRGFSLAALFVLIALAAILLAMFRSSVQYGRAGEIFGDGDTLRAGVNAAAGLIVGIGFSVLLARAYDVGPNGMLLGVFAGGSAGLAGGIAASIPYHSVLALVGTGLLLLIGFGVRLASARRVRPPEAPPPELLTAGKCSSESDPALPPFAPP
jgi:hypothetical protein